MYFEVLHPARSKVSKDMNNSAFFNVFLCNILVEWNDVAKLRKKGEKEKAAPRKLGQPFLMVYFFVRK